MKTTKFIAREKCIKNGKRTDRYGVIIRKAKASVNNSGASANAHKKDEDNVEKQKNKERYIVVENLSNSSEELLDSDDSQNETQKVNTELFLRPSYQSSVDRPVHKITFLD